MVLLILALLILAVAFGVGALIHFLWLGLVVFAIVALITFVARAL